LNIIDCDEVADFLEPLLADVTTRLIIRQGCQLASETATEQLDAEIATLNQYDQITFEGTCLAEVPLYDDEIDLLVSDDFTVIWGNDESDLYTMDATFQATRANAASQ
jgi:hypothetical protein